MASCEPLAKGNLDALQNISVPCRDYWKAQINCQDACPVHTDARGYVRAVAAGDFEMAYLIARGPNVLASICGRVCGAPCEAACRRGAIDKPVAIRALKRFVCEAQEAACEAQEAVCEAQEAAAGPGTAAGSDGDRDLASFLKEAASRHAPRTCEDREELLPLLQSLLDGDIRLSEGKSVGIIGSGPAGLAAAHDLALLGFAVTIYEMEPVLAGMLAVGIPEYRLPRDLIQAEVNVILELGVTARTDCEIGKDVTLAELRTKHDAVVIATGAKRSTSLPVPGVDAEGVLGGVEFLRAVSLGSSPSLGKRIVVIGGGNVAYDVGRTVLRQIAIDAARTALRESGVSAVYLCSLESLDEMPADDVEIIEGDEEGIIRRNGMGPVEIVKDGSGKVSAVVLKKCLRVFDENHRFAPLFDESARETIPCDTVLVSIGQGVDLSFIDPEKDGIEKTERGFVPCDIETGKTSVPDVFIAGDLAYGPKLLIHAIASGKKVARAIYESLEGRPIDHKDVELHLAIPDFEREAGYETRKRVTIPTTAVAERLGSQDAPVEKPLDEEAALAEAGRCLDCGINTIFDGEKCLLCGGCADVCPRLCLRLVSSDRLSGDKGFRGVVDSRLEPARPEEGAAILKDETDCIRCGLCAERCPVGAITMERFIFKEVPRCPPA